jgi:hypothetical protein
MPPDRIQGAAVKPRLAMAQSRITPAAKRCRARDSPNTQQTTLHPANPLDPNAPYKDEVGGHCRVPRPIDAT